MHAAEYVCPVLCSFLGSRGDEAALQQQHEPALSRAAYGLRAEHLEEGLPRSVDRLQKRMAVDTVKTEGYVSARQHSPKKTLFQLPQNSAMSAGGTGCVYRL